ncbi:MAG: hypothetical protein ACXW1Z_17955 [Methylobacter sp.]
MADCLRQPLRTGALPCNADEPYCYQPFCEAVLAQQMYFLFVCKPDSHTLLYEWVDDFTRTGEVRAHEKSRWNGKQRLTERYRYIIN